MEKLENQEESMDVLDGRIEFSNDTESELHRLSRDSKERELYFMREKSLKDEISALSKAKEEGLNEGLNKKALEIAINLLDILDNETISIKTGLSIDQVIALRNNIII